MQKGRKKYLVKIVALIMLIISGAFLLNFFLTYKLENYLKQKLSEKVSEATNGFYILNFDKLKIGLFDGELQLEGVDLHPDSSAFARSVEKDSLPQLYVNTTIKKIRFRGVNLTWKTNYKKLNFDLFEVEDPAVSIYQSGRDKPDTSDSKGIVYEYISPFIDVLTVKKINLDNATIIYTAKEDNNSGTFALKNISFHAYNFRLDENSYLSGKLLYCQNFDFITNQPQVLLSNSQLDLNVDKISLNTEDSLIYIEKVVVEPKDLMWAKVNKVPQSFLSAKVDTIRMTGAYFIRDRGLSYLKAKSFDIHKSDIEYYNFKTDTVIQTKLKEKKPSFYSTWSLYSLISPLLHSITIEKIDIGNTKLTYSLSADDYTDTYKMDSLNFRAYNFKIDSLADIERKYLYSDGFDVGAYNIAGEIESKNHGFRVNQMYLSLEDSIIEIKGIRLFPLSTRSKLDYMQGTIDSIRLSGLLYDKGVKAKKLQIDDPQIIYVKQPSQIRYHIKSDLSDTTSIASTTATQIDLITPFFGFLSIDSIVLKKGNITYKDRSGLEEMVYKLPKLNFIGTKFRLNKDLVLRANIDSICEKFIVEIGDIDNLLPGKDYRLVLESGVYDNQKGDIKLNNVQLIPQIHSGPDFPAIYYSAAIPIVQLKGLIYNPAISEKEIQFDSFEAISPKIKIIKSKDDTDKRLTKQKPFRLKIKSNFLNIKKIDLQYEDKTINDNISVLLSQLYLKQISWDTEDQLSVDQIIADGSDINIIKGSGKAKSEKTKSWSKDLYIGNIDLNNIKFSLNAKELDLISVINNIHIKRVIKKNDTFNLDDIELTNSSSKINQVTTGQNISQKRKQNDLYTQLVPFAKFIRIGKFNLGNANIDYSNTTNGKKNVNQKINSTNFNFTEFIIDKEKRTFNIQDFNFDTKNIRFPLDNGFYTMQIGKLSAHKRDASLALEDLHLIPLYPKKEFAYKHPQHKDWFDVSAGRLILSAIDYPNYFTTKMLNIGLAEVQDVKLLNYKNQNIEIEHHVMPMIYEGLQKLPVKLNIDSVDVRNLYVQYEELSKGKDEAGKIFFTDMNGLFKGFTNIVNKPQQYIELDTDGKLMGSGYYKARWYIPVDSLNKRFLLTANLSRFDLTELNQLVSPMVPAKINSGIVESLIFKTEASDKNAKIQMRFLYNGLNISIYKDKDGKQIQNKTLSNIANAVLKKSNPDKKKKKPREPFLEVVRDPYHSTFNYLWQILQPAVVESVGMSQKKQNIFKSISSFITRVKDFIEKKKFKKETEKIVPGNPDKKH